ncbi:hypothetical protein ACQP1U_11715 [Actinomycetota bacterium]
MSLSRAILAGIAATALAATTAGAASGSTASPDSSRVAKSDSRQLTGSARTGTEAMPAECGVAFDSFTGFTHVRHEVIGADPIQDYPGHTWKFVPRKLAYYKSVLSDATYIDYYYAVSPSGYLYRVGEKFDSETGAPIGSPAYVIAASGWQGMKDIQVRGTRLYYITSTGELRRRAIVTGGAITSAGTLIRNGLSIVQLSNLGSLDYLGSTGTVISRYDQFLGITSGGALQRMEVRYSGSVGTLSRLNTLKGAGWNRFNSIDVGSCDRPDLDYAGVIVGRDWATKTALVYVDADIFNTSGTDLTYSHKPAGSLPNPTFGA